MKNRIEPLGNRTLLERLRDVADRTGETSSQVEAEGEGRRAKQEYDDCNRRPNVLKSGGYASLLDCRYVPGGNPSFAVVSPVPGQFDVNSRRLLRCRLGTFRKTAHAA
jgi:hypothetical protein